MINQGFYRVIPTGIRLNGPILSFTQIPSGISGNPGDTVQLVGIATATFPVGITTSTGSIAYRWYEVGVGALSDGNRLSGTSTNTLTISNLQSPGDSNRRFYLEAKFNPSAYGSGINGRAINEPIYSDEAAATVAVPLPTASLSASSSSIAYNGSVTLTWSTSNATTLTSNFGVSSLSGTTTIQNLTNTTTFSIVATNSAGADPRSVTVNVGAAPVSPAPPPPPPPPPAPSITITSQPVSTTSTYNKCSGEVSAQFSVAASVSNQTSASLQYQWYLNGSALSNGANVAGAQSPTLTLKVLESQSGNNTVYVRVSYTGASTVQSNTVNYSVTVVELKPNLTITQQPSNQTVSTNQTATFTVQGNIDNYERTPSYQWYNAATGTALTDVSTPSGTISGTNTRTLSVSFNTASTTTYYARVFDSSTTCTSVPSSINSNTVTLTVSAPQNIIFYSPRSDESTAISYDSYNLTTSSFTSSSSLEIYAPEKDINVIVTLRGGKGADNGSFKGGSGGITQVSLTLRKNTEYIIRIPGSNNGTGGQAVYLYEKGQLRAVAGGGGSAGRNGNGGAGGGGNSGGAAGGGSGGGSATSSSMQTIGFFCDGNVYCDTNQPTSRTGGQASRCPPGDPSCAGAGYWRSNFSSCSDYGVSQARNLNGTIVAGSAVIARGFKGGVGHRNNAGYAQASGDGAGGQGARGGNAAQIVGSGSGGSGGSGWSDLPVISSSLGGNSGSPQFTIALA